MRVRTQTAVSPRQAADPAPEDDPERVALRDRSAALLAAADTAISRALSHDSAEFLAQNRQEGGE
jgi:hypothetical protein